MTEIWSHGVFDSSQRTNICKSNGEAVHLINGKGVNPKRAERKRAVLHGLIKGFNNFIRELIQQGWHAECEISTIKQVDAIEDMKTQLEETGNVQKFNSGGNAMTPLGKETGKDVKLKVLTLFDLPENVATTIFGNLQLLDMVPVTIPSLRISSKEGNEWLNSHAVWDSLEASLCVSSGTTAQLGPSRHSSRLGLNSQQSFVAAWRRVVLRNEALHHALANFGKSVTLSQVKGLIERWGPLRPLMDRASPVYNATVLMQVCLGSTREVSLIACVERLILHEGCDPNARPPYEGSVTPLIIAASRGLPKLTALLLAFGADPSARGEDRFRLCCRTSSVPGCWRAIEWVQKLREAVASASITDYDVGLCRCHRLLQLVEDRQMLRNRASSDVRPSTDGKEAGERAAQLLREAMRFYKSIDLN